MSAERTRATRRDLCPAHRPATVLTSQEFTTLAGFRKAKDELREQARVAHGFPEDKRARFHPDALVLEVYLDGWWIGYTSSMPDAADRVKVNRHVRPVPSRLRLTYHLPPESRDGASR